MVRKLGQIQGGQKELDDLKGRYQELFRTIENEGAAVANLALETAIANREAQQAIADKALEVALKNSEAMQKIREDDLRFQTTFQSTNIAIRMEYEKSSTRQLRMEPGNVWLSRKLTAKLLIRSIRRL